jgi:hypothetical protein
VKRATAVSVVTVPALASVLQLTILQTLRSKQLLLLLHHTATVLHLGFCSSDRFAPVIQCYTPIYDI